MQILAWKPLGVVSPRQLVEARLLLHHAGQLVAAVGRGLVPARPADEPPELPAGGRWHREGWTGALLTGSEIVATGGGAAQVAEASSFLSGTVELLRDAHARRR